MSEIRNLAFARQRADFSGLRFGNINDDWLRDYEAHEMARTAR